MLGVLVAGSATAQNNTNALPPMPAPAIAPIVINAPPAVTDTNAPVKKTVHKHKKHAATALAAHKAPFSEPAITLVPGPAEVFVSHVNVRGQAGLKGEVIAHVQKGDAVTVLGQINLDKHKADEPAQWAKIALPASTTVWVRTSFIDATNKTVLPKKLNLRAGPSEDYSVLGTIDRGTVVNETGSKGEWTKIDAPTNSYAFVAAMYLKQEASGNVPTNPAPSTETALVTDTNTVAPGTNLIADAQPILPESGTNTAATDTNSLPSSETDTNTLTGAPTASTDTNGTSEVDTNAPELPIRTVTHEGSVRHVTSLIEPTAYELFDRKTGLDIDYLYTTSTNLDFSKYNGLHIIVTGDEGLAERWKNTPVLTVKQIQVVE